MQEYGFHYLTDSPKKIIDSYKRREKRIIDDLNFVKESLAKIPDEDARKIWMSGFSPEGISLSNMEDVVIKNNGAVLSIYTLPIRIKHKEMWSNFDARPKSVAQLNGSLFVIQEDDDIAMQLWHKGELLAESFGKDADSFYLLFGTYFPQAGSNLHPMQFEEIERALRFPLLLPGDWEVRWSIQQISEHIFLAEDRNE